jgi:opacity protein-like surface antigen
MKTLPRLTIAIATMGTIIAMSAGASAQDASGFFISANVGPSQYKLEEVDTKNKFLAGVGVGYSFNPNIALEVGFNDYGKINVDFVNARARALHLSLLLSAPLANDFSMYGRLGVARTEIQAEAFDISVTDRKTRALYGVGVGYNFAKNIKGTVEFQNQKLDHGDVRAVAVGVKFQF